MNMQYVAAMPLRKDLLANPDGKIPVIEHALHTQALKSLCGDIKEKLQVLKHEWDPISPYTCKKCLRRYNQISA